MLRVGDIRRTRFKNIKECEEASEESEQHNEVDELHAVYSVLFPIWIDYSLRQLKQVMDEVVC